MYEFSYVRPASVADAAKLLTNHPGAKLLAGGMSLIPLMKLRLADPPRIVDLCDLSELSGIEVTADAVTLRGMTTHARVAASPDVRRAIPALAALAQGIGDPHCRNRGTIGGSLAHSDPAACYPAGALALGAAISTNWRQIPADAFFKGVFETALETGEIITAVSFPVPDAACYLKFPQPASRFAMVGVFVARKGKTVRVAVTGAAAKAFRVTEFEEALTASFAPEALAGLSVPSAGLNEDIHADPEYRAHLIKLLAARAVTGCGGA